MQTVPSECKLIVEIKNGIDIAGLLKSEVEKCGLRSEQIEFIAFNYKTISKVKRINPAHKSFLLAELDYTWISSFFSASVDKLIIKAVKAGLDGLDLWAGNQLNPDEIKKIKQAGLKLYVWTVNDSAKAEQLAEWGVDGITTDRAGWLSKILTQTD